MIGFPVVPVLVVGWHLLVHVCVIAVVLFFLGLEEEIYLTSLWKLLIKF